MPDPRLGSTGQRTAPLPDEDRLVRSAAGGDPGAFGRLVEHYQSACYGLAWRLLGDSELAADATQDAFLHAYRNVATFRGEPEGFQSWLLRIAINACYDQLRRKQRRPSQSLEAYVEAREGESMDLAQDPLAGPEQRAMRSETARNIQAGLMRLPAEQRLTVILCDVQGMSYDDAARVLEVELGTVKSRLSRARAALRDYLAGLGELPQVARRLD